ncbi:hypothetical protein V8G54_000546 [Vigna mungo]|uniref:Uncharacterized protein n=1 Tax=Vigna mungo TaxID=3915 RepID=A0AAQ3P733_VIGMU
MSCKHNTLRYNTTSMPSSGCISLNLTQKTIINYMHPEYCCRNSSYLALQTSGLKLNGETVRVLSSAATTVQSRVPCRRIAPPRRSSSQVFHVTTNSAPMVVHVYVGD